MTNNRIVFVRHDGDGQATHQLVVKESIGPTHGRGTKGLVQDGITLAGQQVELVEGQGTRLERGQGYKEVVGRQTESRIHACVVHGRCVRVDVGTRGKGSHKLGLLGHTGMRHGVPPTYDYETHANLIRTLVQARSRLCRRT